MNHLLAAGMEVLNNASGDPNARGLNRMILERNLERLISERGMEVIAQLTQEMTPEQVERLLMQTKEKLDMMGDPSQQQHPANASGRSRNQLHHIGWVGSL